ncbi:hypothetical protein FB451DRAFT_1412691 [Mycena latifolia]|nr:hypothetical protein FB451DRAFT_1412691 [Mycena latifolia]
MPETEGNLSAHTPHRPRGSPAPPDHPAGVAKHRRRHPHLASAGAAVLHRDRRPFDAFKTDRVLQVSSAAALRRRDARLGANTKQGTHYTRGQPKGLAVVLQQAPPLLLVERGRPSTCRISDLLEFVSRQDNTPPVRALVSPDAGGYVCLADHKVQLGELALEQQRALEKYGIGQVGEEDGRACFGTPPCTCRLESRCCYVITG